MKKVLSFVCAVAVAATCTATAFAADDTATPGQIAQQVIGQVHGGNLNPAQCKMVIDQVLKPLTKGGETHVSKAVASLGHLALGHAELYVTGLTLQNSEVIELQEAVPAPAQSQTAAENEAAVEQPVVEDEAAAEQPAAEPAAEAEAAAEQPVAETKPAEQAEKQFGAIRLCTAAAQTIDFAKVTGSIVDQGKNVYTLTVKMPAGVTNEMTPAGYEVTVYGLNSDNYQMVHGTDVNSEARLDNVIRIAANEKDSTKLDVTFWVPHFSTYTIFPMKAAEQQKPDTDQGSQGSQGSQSSNGSSGSSGYEAPDDSIYYTCPKCGYHNWTAAEGGYLCDHCGYMEVVKELAGWPNVNGVAVKTSNPTSLSAVYAGAIKATGASMSMLALAVVAMAAAAVGGAAYLVRKNGLGE